MLSGIAGNVIIANGSDSLVLSADGAFTFATTLASGAAYNVTVTSQPANQLCAVSNGSGAVGGANVTSVVVTCTTQTMAPSITTQPISQSVIAPATATFYVVVSGTPVPTTQWQLSTNSGATWTDIAGATALSYTTSATITADTGKQYRVRATNTVSSADSNAATLTVTAPTTVRAWQPPVLLSDPTGIYDIYEQKIATNAQGDAIAVWQQYVQAGSSAPIVSSIWANRYVAGSGWQGPIKIASGTTSSITLDNHFQQRPQVVIDAVGNAVVVWEDRVGIPGLYERTDIRAIDYNVGSGWEVDTLIETDDGVSNSGHSADSPVLAIDGNGNATAMWIQGVGGSRSASIMYGNHNAGGAWSAAVSLATGNVGSIQVAGCGAGAVSAVWLQFDGTRFDTYASQWGGAGFSSPQLIDNNSTASTSYPRIACSAGGTAVAVWSEPTLVMASRNVSGVWAGPINLDSTAPSVLAQPMVVMDAAGNAFAWWNGRQNTLTSGIWGNTTAIMGGAGGQNFQATMNASGNTLGIWSGTAMYASDRYIESVGWQWGYAVPLAANNGTTPKISIGDNGDAAAIWIQPGNGANQLWSSAFK